MPTPFDTYLTQLAADCKGGQATEHTSCSTLETLLEPLAPGVEAFSDLNHIACDAPDLSVEQRNVPLDCVKKDIVQAPTTVGTAQELARRMAALTRIIRDMIVGSLRGVEREEGDVFHKQLEAFRHYLMPTLTAEEFADIYAQTMAYGLFAARVNAQGRPFNMKRAYIYFPSANPFLRKLFRDIGEEQGGTPIAPFLDDLAALLAHADMGKILRDFGKRTRTEDPVAHFYETFLAAYDPKMRKSRGVYYTPEPVVQFIVRSVDHLLKTCFNKPMGLADPQVLLLDPSTGTATFLYFVIQLIYDTLQAHGQGGAWQEYARKKLLPRILGFELLMAPFAVAHLKLWLLLTNLGYTFGKHERLGIYLTNTLEPGVTHDETLGLAGYLAEEGSEAAKLAQMPIEVVLGNPPYSNFGMMNKGDWIHQLLQDYKRGLKEKKLNLDDDFIKFIRFGQWRIEQTGQGILAFITNNTYIDGITHRRMRQSLMETFTDIYILNMHGSTKKRETAPDGSKDENVFDIRQGVAINLFVKERGKAGTARVHYADLWGLREDKYTALSETNVSTVEWTELEPKPEQFFFVPKPKMAMDYQQYWPLDEIFIKSGGGLNTDLDELCIDFERKPLEKRMRLLFSGKYDETFKEKYRIYPSSSYDIKARAQQGVFRSSSIKTCVYRPFDFRFIYYQLGFTSRPVFKVQGHMLNFNLALLGTRQSKEDFAVLASSHISTHKIVAVYDRTYIFPLYLYTTLTDTADTFFAQSGTTRAPNLVPEFIQAVSDKLNLTFVPDGAGDLRQGGSRTAPTTFGPEDVFHYAYAVFHSPAYRIRYAEFLKTDFPRLPLTSNRKLFATLAAQGAELVSLHLLQSPVLDVPITTFPVSGSNTVEKITPRPVEQGTGVGVNVYINAEQYFGGVPEAVWKFHIGGYQVCDKWLKDRKGRMLTGDDIAHYQRIVVALKETIRLMQEIDAAIPGWPIE